MSAIFYGDGASIVTDTEERFARSLQDENVRPVEDQTKFDLSESDRTILEIFDSGNCNEYGCEAGELDWPTL